MFGLERAYPIVKRLIPLLLMRAMLVSALALFGLAQLCGGEADPAEAKAKGPEHNVTLTEEPGVLDLLAKAQKARARAEKDPEVWPECVKYYAEILKKYPATVYLDKWEGPDKTEMAFKNGLYKSTRERVAKDIASLPPGGLAVYRVINDPAARTLYNDAVEQFDERKMEQVAREYFPTSFGDDALLWLAEISASRGQHRQTLLRLNQALKHPNLSIGKTGLLVRLLQAQLGLNDRASAAKTLQDLEAALTDDKAGALRVGHDEGAAALAKLKARVARTEGAAGTPVTRVEASRSWETYFGNASHNTIPPSRNTIGLRKWSVSIRQLFEGPSGDASNAGKVVQNDGTPIADPTMNYHLTAKDAYFYIVDANLIASYPTGNPQPGLSSAGGNIKFLYPNESVPAPKSKEANVRVNRRVFRQNQNSGVRQHPYFVSVSGERIYATIGAEAVTQDQDMWRGQEVKQPSNFLVALGFQSGKLIWTLQPDMRSPAFEAHSKADQEWLKSVYFVSAPTVDAGVLYVMAVGVHGLHDAFVAAFDADNGRLIWRTQVCSANPFSVGGPVQPDLGLPVAVANGMVYVTTNLGGVAALDATSGTIKWLRVYDRLQTVDRFNNQGRRLSSDFWAPNPPVIHENLLLVTPQDSEFLYAYDIESGKRVWEVSRTERDTGLKHLLGITNGNLVVTGGNVHFYELKGGRETGPADPIVFDSPIKGRGTVTENVVLIPTEKALISLDTALEAGKFRPKIRSTFKWMQPELEAGNIVVAGDVLYTVSRTHVNAYFVWEEMERKLRERIKKDPADLNAFGELADVYHKVDKFDLALIEIDKGIGLAEKMKDDAKTAAALPELRRKKFDALTELGKRLQVSADGKPDLAAAYEHFKKALDVAKLPRQADVLPVRALRAMAETAVLRDDLALGILHYHQIISRHGDTVYSYMPESSAKARLFAQARIEELKKKQPAAYEKLEAEAAAAYSKAGSDMKQLAAVLASYPNSNTSGLAMLKLAQLAVDANPDQTRLYALNFLSRHGESPEAGNATALLALAYERSKLLGPAKDVLRRLSTRKELAETQITLPAKATDPPAVPIKAPEWAAKRLAEPQFQQALSSATLSTGDGKLKLGWSKPALEMSVPLAPAGIAPFDLRRRLFFIENQSELALLSSTDRGEEAWLPRPKLPQDVLPKPNPQDQARLQGAFQPPSAVWAEHLLIVMGSRELVAYDSREKGKVAWRKELKNPVPQQRCSLQASFGRVVIGYPSGGLSVMDAASGEQLWFTQVEGNQFFPAPAIGDGFVAVGAQNPARITLFELETGNRRGVLDSAAGNLTIAPEAHGDRLYFAERNTLKAVDGNSGKLIWNSDMGGNITRLEVGRELVVAVTDGKRVAAMSTTAEAGPGKIWSPVLDKDATVKDVYIDGDDLYVTATSADRKSSVSAHAIRLQGKKQWEVDISSAQIDTVAVSAATVSRNHLMLTQSNWDPSGDKPTSVVLIDRKTGRITWSDSLGAEHRTVDNEGITHPAFTAQLVDGGVIITESKKRTAWLVPDASSLEESIKSLTDQVAAKPADLSLRYKLGMRQYEKGEIEAALANLSAAFGNKDLTDERFAAYFSDFSRLRQERAKKQKRAFEFAKVPDGSKLDITAESWKDITETTLNSWSDVYFVSDDETSGAIKKNFWKGPDDLKATFRGAYDEKNLYMLFVVTDDKHKNEHTDGTYCDVGDSVKVVFDNDSGDALLVGGMGYRGEDFALGACVNDKGAILSWRWVEHGQYTSGTTPMSPAPEVVRHEARKQTVYKLTLPLAYLTLKAEAGRKFGFSFIVNDQDEGAAVTKSIGGSPGVLGPPYPALFSEGVLR